MKEFDPFREFLFDYITVVAENTLAIAVIGSIFAGDVNISFGYFFLPFFAGISVYAALYPDLSERGYDGKADFVAERH